MLLLYLGAERSNEPREGTIYMHQSFRSLEEEYANQRQASDLQLHPPTGYFFYLEADEIFFEMNVHHIYYPQELRHLGFKTPQL